MNTCYYCMKKIENDDDMVLHTVRIENQKKEEKKFPFHEWCVDDYEQENKLKFSEDNTEQQFFDKTYRLILDYLEVDNEGEKYSTTTLALRIKGLSNGEYITKGKGTKARKGGFSYEEIYRTLQFKSVEIKRGLKNIDFKDGNHKMNYIFSVLRDNILFMAQRVRKSKKAEEIANKIDVKVLDDKYIKKVEDKEDKRTVLKDAFKNMETDDESPFDDLF